MQKLGGMGGIMGMMPGMGKMKDQMSAAGMDDKTFARQLAIIGSMTKAERANPDILKHSRKKRIAAGSGTDAAAINKLLKMHRQMADMMKAMGGKGKGGGMMRAAMGGLAQDGASRRHGWNGRHAGSVEDGSEAARSAAEAGGSRRPRQGRHAAFLAECRGVARTGWAEAARSWRRRPSRPAEEEVRAAHEHQ
jgi:signal recognition particle subunit SRP54